MRFRDFRRAMLLCIGMFTLLLATPAFSQSTVAKEAVPNRLIGAWKLISLEEPTADGKVRQLDCSGMFVFSRGGKASVQVMYRNAQAGSTYAQGGYEASYGSYRLDNASTFTFHIDGALVRTLIGKDLKRAYEISGNRLTVKSTDPSEHWKVIWERY
jgi:Lipocalin-like domain